MGATVEQVGFDKSNTAGGLNWLLSHAIQLVPELEHAALANIWSGLRPWSPDSYPILGKAPGWENVILATGHGAGGFELSAITGKTIAELVTTGYTSALIQPFGIERFMENGTGINNSDSEKSIHNDLTRFTTRNGGEYHSTAARSSRPGDASYSRIAACHATCDKLSSSLYSTPVWAEQGTQSLINFLVEKINREQGLSLQPGNLMVVAGSTHAVDMVARLYARAGGVVLVEAPTYVDSIHIFRDHQIELCAIPMDEDGLIPERIGKSGSSAQHRMANLPASSIPCRIFITRRVERYRKQRRREIIGLARHYGFLIVEDDVYRDLSFEGVAEGVVPGSFYALAQGKQVLSIGSFSKTLAPGLRLGWLLGAEDDIQRCVNCGTTQMGGGANPFVANMVAEYCLSGHWETHIMNLRSLYKTRCNIALAALEQYMSADVGWTRPAGGFFIWLSLPENVFAQDVKRMALQEGVLVAAGEGFFVTPAEGEHNLRLAFSCAAPGEIEKGIRILSEVIDRTRGRYNRRAAMGAINRLPSCIECSVRVFALFDRTQTLAYNRSQSIFF